MNLIKLPHMISLLDDETPEVRSEIIVKLYEYGINLERDLADINISLNNTQTSLLVPIIIENRKKWIINNWDLALNFSDPYQKLESALTVLSYFHYGMVVQKDLPILLDELAAEFSNKIPYGDELDLAIFLFKEKSIQGASKNYNNSFNSNLIYTLKEKRGLPITLALIYMLIGKRLGFLIEGCNYPGHFLTRINLDSEIVFIDCFNGGKIILENELAEIVKEIPLSESVIYEATSANIILQRVLNNLANSYTLAGDQDSVIFFNNLSSHLI